MAETRGRGRRTWVKIYVTGYLHGSIRWQLTSAERGVWTDLIALAGECGMEGRICDHDERPYPRLYIANMLNIEPALLKTTIEKCVTEGRLTQEGESLSITNWAIYQSEYERQKPYREKEFPPVVSP